MAEGVSDAFAKGSREFRSVEGVAGQCETLLTPDLLRYGGKAVGKGWPLLVVPGAGRDPELISAVEARCQQGDDREQAEQARCGAGNGFVRGSVAKFSKSRSA